MTNITTLVGAQAGSEGKGAIAAHLARLGAYRGWVRTGGPNAGHTFYHEGRKWVARSVPCGWIDPDAWLYIGPGAVIDPDVLVAEIREIEAAGYEIGDRLKIDPRATVITPHQHHGEGGVEGVAHQRIGSTGEGVGLARMARINRGSLLEDSRLVHRSAQEEERLAEWIGVLDVGADLGAVMLEGTQGSKLSLTNGPWPYCTSADTNSAQLISDAGMSPGDFTKCILVARTFPIRVAGNSGPLPLETTWGELNLSPETTTVTKKVRRVGWWTDEWVREAILLNRPATLALTFLDYVFSEVAGHRVWDEDVDEFLGEIEDRLGIQCCFVATGPDTVVTR